MLPYAAHDLLNTMRYEMTPEEERRHGTKIAQDVSRDNDHDDLNKPDKGLGIRLRLNFLHAAFITARGP